MTNKFAKAGLLSLALGAVMAGRSWAYECPPGTHCVDHGNTQCNIEIVNGYVQMNCEHVCECESDCTTTLGPMPGMPEEPILSPLPGQGS